MTTYLQSCTYESNIWRVLLKKVDKYGNIKWEDLQVLVTHAATK